MAQAAMTPGAHGDRGHGGHLLQAHVCPTLEVIVIEEPEYLERRPDERAGLALIDVAAG